MHADMMPLDADLREQIQQGTIAFPLQYYADALYKCQNQIVPQHWHPELEFVVAMGGDIQVLVWDRQVALKSGEGIFLNVNTLHGFQQLHPTDRCICPNIVFSDELIAPVASTINQKYIKPVTLDETLPFIILKRETPWQNEILSRLDTVFSLCQRYGRTGPYEMTPVLYLCDAELVDCFEMRIQEELNRIWQTLYGNLSMIPRIPILKRDAAQQIRMQKMLAYIHKNYMLPITLANIASAAAIGKSEATRCFQKYMKNSPVSYLVQYRISQAKQLLQNPLKNIVQVCIECGFQSPSYFSKVFRRETGMTPIQYRQYVTP